MSGAMNDSMNGPPPGYRPRRDICWMRTRPPGNTLSRRAFTYVGVVALADVLAHLEGGDRVERAVGDLAVVLQPDLDPVLQTALARSRSSMNRFCSGAMVTPVTCAPKCSAAYRLSEPQPQPTSSSRIPGVRARACGRPGRACRAARPPRCTRRRPTRPVPARVRHVRVEDQRVELVGQVVVVRDRRRGRGPGCAAGRGAAPGCPARAARRPEDAEVRGRRAAASPEPAGPGRHPAETALARDRPTRASAPSSRSPSTSSSPVT